MRAGLSSEQQQYRDEVAEFTRREIAPRVEELEQAAPGELLAVLGAAGLTGLCVPQSHGGSDRSTVDLCLALEELASESVAIAGAGAIQNALVAGPIASFGSSAIQESLLPGLAAGASAGCFAWQEPAHRGGTASCETLARRTDGGFALSGVKTDVGGLAGAAFALVVAVVEGEEETDLFVVPLDASGVSSVTAGPSLTAFASRAGQLSLDGVRVAETARISGRDVVGSTVARGRVAAAAIALGVCRSVFDAAREALTAERDSGVESAQSLQFHLADMATELDASRLLTWKAASAEAPSRAGLDAARAQLFAIDSAQRLSGLALSIAGSAGLARGRRLERQFRAARALELLVDSRESQKRAIAAQVVDRG